MTVKITIFKKDPKMSYYVIITLVPKVSLDLNKTTFTMQLVKKAAFQLNGNCTTSNVIYKCVVPAITEPNKLYIRLSEG